MNAQAGSMNLTSGPEKAQPDAPLRLRGSWLALGRKKRS